MKRALYSLHAGVQFSGRSAVNLGYSHVLAFDFLALAGFDSFCICITWNLFCDTFFLALKCVPLLSCSIIGDSSTL